MNEQRCPAPAPGWRLEGEAVGAGGTLPAPPPPPYLGCLPLRVGPPLCAVSAPLRPRAPQPALASPLRRVGCGPPVCAIGQGLAALRPPCASDPCVPRGPRRRSRGLSWKAASPWTPAWYLLYRVPPLDGIPRRCPLGPQAGGQGVSRLASCPKEPPAWGWGALSGPLRAQTDRCASLPWARPC